MSLSQPAMSLEGERRPIIFHMVLNMDETRLKTIFQLRAFWPGLWKCFFVRPATTRSATLASSRWPSALATLGSTGR